MPEIIKKPNGDVDWQKIFMGFAIALVYVMQSYHAIQVADLKANTVSRAEIDRKADKIMDKTDIIDALDRLSERLDGLEDK